MSEIDFSLLLPTRHRALIVERLFKSIKATAQNPGNLEVVLYIDEDDTESQNIAFSGFSVVKIIGRRETMARMTNLCFEASRGHFIMLINDDVIFRTYGWDKKIREAFSGFSDDIALIYGNDLYQRGGVGTFPVLTRTELNIMGGVCPDEYKYSHIDTHLYDIFRKLGSMGHRRSKYLSDVIFEHMHYEAGKSAMDDIYKRKNPKEDEIAYIIWDEERRWLANRLAGHIKSRKSQVVSGKVKDQSHRTSCGQPLGASFGQ